MSALKTLVPVPAGAPDVPRGRQAVLAIPPARSAENDPVFTTRSSGSSSSFQGLLAEASAGAKSPRARSEESATTSEASRRCARSKDASRSTRGGNADGSNHAAGSPRHEKTSRSEKSRMREREDRADEESARGAAEDTEASRGAARGDGGDDDDVDAVGQAEERASAASGADPGLQGEAPSGEDAGEASSAGGTDGDAGWLRNLTPLGVGMALAGGSTSAGPGGATASAAGGTSAMAGTAASVTGAVGAEASAEGRLGLLDAKVASVPAPDRTALTAQKLLAGGSAPGAPAGKPAPMLQQGTTASASSGVELARLVAIAAGLTGEIAADDDKGASSGGAPAPGARNGGQKVDSAAGDASAARGSFAEIAGRTSGHQAVIARAESFGDVLARAQSTSDEAAGDVGRVAELVRSNIGTRNSSVTIRLDPPELGQIQLDARLRDDVLSLRIQAETTTARDLLQSRLGDLRRALEQHGITLDRVDIEPRSPSPSPGSREPGDGNPDNRQERSTGQESSGQWQQQETPSGSTRGGTDGGAGLPVDADYSNEQGGDGSRQGRLAGKDGPAVWVTPTSVNVLV